MTAKISSNDLPPELQRQLGIRKPRKHTFTKETVRAHAIRCLSAIADLTQDQRRRVLDHATKLNKI
jgi:hypothetical protein